MYNITSKDYNMLYDIILNKNEIICILDYNEDDNNRFKMQKDICFCHLDVSQETIVFICRGYTYKTIPMEHPQKQKIFINFCNMSNLEYIKPQVRIKWD
jgi:hypothetical protein